MSCFLSNSVNGDLWPQANDLVQTLNVLTLFIHTHSQPTCELYKLGLIFKHFFFFHTSERLGFQFSCQWHRDCHTKTSGRSIRHILVDIKNKTNSFNKTLQNGCSWLTSFFSSKYVEHATLKRGKLLFPPVSSLASPSSIDVWRATRSMPHGNRHNDAQTIF